MHRVVLLRKRLQLCASAPLPLLTQKKKRKGEWQKQVIQDGLWAASRSALNKKVSEREIINCRYTLKPATKCWNILKCLESAIYHCKCAILLKAPPLIAFSLNKLHLSTNSYEFRKMNKWFRAFQAILVLCSNVAASSTK